MPSFETQKTFRVCPCQIFFMFEPFPSFVSYHAHHDPGVSGSGWAFDKHAQKRIPFLGTLLGSSRLTSLLQLSIPSINRIASVNRDPSGTLLTFSFALYEIALWLCLGKPKACQWQTNSCFRETPLVLSMWPCKLKLDEHAGLAQQNDFGPAFLHSLLMLVKDKAKPKTWCWSAR